MVIRKISRQYTDKFYTLAVVLAVLGLISGLILKDIIILLFFGFLLLGNLLFAIWDELQEFY